MIMPILKLRKTRYKALTHSRSLSRCWISYHLACGCPRLPPPSLLLDCIFCTVHEKDLTSVPLLLFHGPVPGLVQSIVHTLMGLMLNMFPK